MWRWGVGAKKGRQSTSKNPRVDDLLTRARDKLIFGTCFPAREIASR